MSLIARAATLSPFGPLFGKELRVTSRRKRTYLLRVGYLGLLLLALLLAFASTGRSYGGVAAQMQRQAALGTAFFLAFTIFSVGAMGLIGPVLTANAIGAEKLAKTLPVLLMTPITAWQIVSGKLLSRVLIALMLLGLSLPVLALCRLLGGVELEQMLAVISIATSFVISCAAIGLFLSLFLNRAAVVILLSYGLLGVLYVLLPAVLISLFDVGKNGPGVGFDVILAMNPFGCAVMMCEPRMGGFVGNTWITCVFLQLGFAAVLVGWTAIMLRRQFRNGGEGGGVAVPAIPAPPKSLVAGPPPLLAQPPDLPNALTPPPLDAPERSSTDTSLNPPSTARNVGENPVLWREIRRPLFARNWQRAVSVLVVIAIMVLIYAVLGDAHALDEADAQIGFACVLFGVWWLLSAVLSATAISQEKETDTWTLLLATPMSGSQIVWGKVAGLMRRLLWPTVLIVVHFLLFVLGGVIPFWSLLFVLVMTVACNSLWIATGIWASLKIKRVTFAVIANLMLAVVAYGVVPLVVLIPGELLTRNGDDLAEHTGWYIPYFYLAQGFDGLDRLGYGRASYYYGSYPSYQNDPFYLPGNGRVAAPTFVTMAMLCAAAHVLVAYLLLERTAVSFDEIVGRAGKRQFVGIDDTDDRIQSVHDLVQAPATIEPTSADGAELAAEPELYATFGRRVLAASVDTALIVFLCGVIGLVWGMIDVLTQAVDDMDDDVTIRVLRGYLWNAVLVSFVVGAFYWAWFESSRKRATPGKQLMGIFVSDLHGRRLSFGRALLRHVGKIVSTLPAGIGYLEVFTNRRRQTLHDRLARAVVLRR